MTSPVDPAAHFDAVGGHKASMFYGNRTSDGRTTLQKNTTAWEILWYTGLQFTSASEDVLSSLPPLSARFVKAVAPLRSRVPLFFSFRVPATFAPKTTELQAVVKAMGGVEALQERWLEINDAAVRPMLLPLFVELMEGTSALHTFEPEYDNPIWGLGLVDETAGMAEPCVMDIKLGYFRHSPFTPAEKVERMNRKDDNSLTRQTAARICGVRRYLHAGQTTKEEYGKELGYAIATEPQLQAAIQGFFASYGPLATKTGKDTVVLAPEPNVANVEAKEVALARERCTKAAAYLGELFRFFHTDPDGVYLLEKMAIVSASILFTYDAAAGADSTDVLLIDFARSGLRSLNFDEKMIGFAEGLKNVVRYLGADPK